jgi:hypothetical protein
MPIKNTAPLDELLAAPVRSISAAQQTLNISNISHLTALMEINSDGSYAPRVLTFIFSSPGEEPKPVSIPLIALVSLPQMLIDDVSIGLNAGVRYSLISDKSAPLQANGDSSPSKLLCTLLPEKNDNNRQQGPSMKISLKVQRGSPSEAIRQIQDRLLDAAGRKV